MVTLVNKDGERSFDLLHAQRILQWQEAHPKEKDVWVIKKGEPYQYKNGELIGNTSKRKVEGPESEKTA